MQIQVRWKNGALYPVRSLRLKHETVMVEIDDDELEDQGDSYAYIPNDLLKEVARMQDRFEAIRNAQPTSDDTLSELTQKQMNRIEAFAWRDVVKKNRGIA